MQLNVERCDLAAVVREAVETIGPAIAAKEQHLRLELAEGMILTGDPDRLRQVVWDLLANAATVTPVGGESKNVEVPIKNGRSENHIAQDIRDALKRGLSAEYTVEVDDGEDVLVKAKAPTPKFTVALLDSSVKSVRIHVQTE